MPQTALQGKQTPNPASSTGLIYHSHLAWFHAVTVVWRAERPGTPVEISPPFLFTAAASPALRKHQIG